MQHARESRLSAGHAAIPEIQCYAKVHSKLIINQFNHTKTQNIDGNADAIQYKKYI